MTTQSAWRVVVTALLSMVLVAAACSDGTPHARTYYESIDLSAPEHAAMAFVEAYAQDDFFRVWLVMDRDAQADATAVLSFRRLGDLVDTAAFGDFEQVWPGANFDIAEVESIDAWYTFDRLLWFADGHDALLFDFTGTEHLTQVDATAFSVSVGDGSEIVIETMERAGRWRVLTVVYPTAQGGVAHWPRNE